METKKKKLSKKAVIIGSVVLAVVLVVGGVWYYNSKSIKNQYQWSLGEERYTFSEITQGLSEKVYYVKYEDSTLSEGEEEQYYNALLKYNYKHVKNTGSGEYELKVLFYDESDNLLFYINMYRYGAIFIKGDDFTGTYYMTTVN